jgi:hypothetical protein
MSDTKYTLIVARYNEDLEWLDIFDKDSVIIYNKGEYIKDCKYKQICVPNIGRETETYFRYIIDNYYSLPNVVVFTQGAPDHLDRYKIRNVNDLVNIDKHSKNFGLSTFHDAMSSYRLTDYRGNKLDPSILNGKDWFKIFIDSTIDIDKTYIPITWGACFSVKKEYILSRPKYYYAYMRPLAMTNNPEICHYFESSWFLYLIYICIQI